MEWIQGQYAFALKPAEEEPQCGYSAPYGGGAEVFFVELRSDVLANELRANRQGDRRALDISAKVSKISPIGSKGIRGEVPDHPTMIEKAWKSVGDLLEKGLVTGLVFRIHN